MVEANKVPGPDYYSILGVEPDATPVQLSRAYRGLMRTHHPDVGHSGADQSELLRIMKAFAVLRHPACRREYDSQRDGRAATLPGQGQGQGQGEGDDAGNRKASPRQPAARQEARNIPVRHTRHRQPQEQGSAGLIRVTPVRWESGPWA